MLQFEINTAFDCKLRQRRATPAIHFDSKKNNCSSEQKAI